MNLKINKTDKKLYEALNTLLKEKKYNDIIVQDILNLSLVSRGTFYNHYKNKDELLLSILNNIFDHCFFLSNNKDIFNYKNYIAHILSHFKENKELISSIINSDAKELFLDEIRERIKPITEKIIQEKLIKNKEVPYKLNLETANESFIVIIKHWFNHNLEANPETIASYYFALV